VDAADNGVVPCMEALANNKYGQLRPECLNYSPFCIACTGLVCGFVQLDIAGVGICAVPKGTSCLLTFSGVVGPDAFRVAWESPILRCHKIYRPDNDCVNPEKLYVDCRIPRRIRCLDNKIDTLLNAALCLFTNAV
jgi:hypothetical protein